MNDEVARKISAMVADDKETLIVYTLGADFGELGMALRRGNWNAKMYSIDERSHGPLGGLQNERDAFKEAGLLDKVPFPLKGSPSEWGQEWMIGKIDLLIIVPHDLDVWLPHIKDGGIVAIDSYRRVKEMVEEHFDPNDAIFHTDHVIAFRVEKGDNDVPSNERE